MARKEDVFAVANFFEINTLCHWRKCPCVTKTQRYGYIWYIGSCAVPSHKTTVGCEKSANVLKGKWHKNIRKCKKTKNHFSRSDFGSWGGFLGVLGTSLYWKVVSEFWFGSPKCHFRYGQNGKNSRISLHIHNVINHSGNLSTWQDTWSLILERSHTIVRNAVNHSPMLELWKDTC